ncbi:hypothetical protein JCM33374_g2919 [Metschnikowia sp. JCM 33374]|nr:hypothetical protein JCM33374_g2919 [Metschnikowia sp. JCM 33374]
MYNNAAALRNHEPSRRGYDTLGDTQVISRHAYGIESDADSSFQEKHVPTSPFQETQLVAPIYGTTQSHEVPDTQVIGQLQPSPVRRLLRNSRLSYRTQDTDTIDDYGDTQDLSNNRTKTNTNPQTLAQAPDLACIQDTQKILTPANSFPGDTQADLSPEGAARYACTEQPDTQVISRIDPPNGPKGPESSGSRLIFGGLSKQAPVLGASPPPVYEETQQDSKPDIDSSPTKYSSKYAKHYSQTNDGPPTLSTPDFIATSPRHGGKSGQFGSQIQIHASSNGVDTTPPPSDREPSRYAPNSPELGSVDSPHGGSITFDVSFENESKLEPTTQVLNTQEEYMDTRYDKSVDLSIRPVFSSSQVEDGKRPLREGVQSDEDVDSPACDDSIVVQKRRRVVVSSSSQSNGATSKASGSSLRVSPVKFGGLRKPWESQNAQGTQRTQPNILSDQSQQNATDVNDIPDDGDDDLDSVDPISSRVEQEVRRDEKMRGNSEEILQNGEQTDSSSELDDMSQDIRGIDLDGFGVRAPEVVTKEGIPIPNTPPKEDISTPNTPPKETTPVSDATPKDNTPEDCSPEEDIQEENIQEENSPKKDTPRTPQKRGRKVPTSSPSELDVLRDEMPTNSSSDVIVDANAVWALHQFKKFPAKVVEYGDVFSLVQFSNDVQAEARNSDLHLLDICIGDVVQLKMKVGDYVVVGLTFYTTRSTIRCIRGYDTVILTKKKRAGLTADPEFMMSLEDICMGLDQWLVHQSRFHIFPDSVGLGSVGIASVGVDSSGLKDCVDLLQDNYTLVRQLVDAGNSAPAKHYAAPVSMDQKLETQYISPRKSAKEFVGVAPRQSDVFNGMLFFVTSIEGARKEHLKEVILSNGGHFIDDEIKNVTIRESSFLGKLLLSSKTLTSFKFGALLADGYSRSAKYLQALTLGWPILADCFVDKVIENPQVLASWPVFLLPAGHSTHTGTVTNLDVYEFRSKFDSGSFLSEQLRNNSRLLSGYTILVLDRKQDNLMMDMCNFIFHAFGASGIKVLKNPKQVDAHLRKYGTEKPEKAETAETKETTSGQRGHRGPRYLVYDNSQGEYSKSHAKGHPRGHARSQTVKASKKSQAVAKTKFGVVDWEWVVQCVISKYIWDPERYVEV